MTNPLRKLGLVAGVILLFSTTLFAQGVRKDDFIINQAGKPIPNASVTICPTTSPITNGVCSPTATVYSDAAETQPITQPLTTGPIGNFGFYATPGEYIATVTGSTINASVLHYSIPCTPSGNAGCGGSGAPGAPVSSVQYNAASVLTGAAGITTDGNQLFIKGPVPFADIRAFGGRATLSGNVSALATISLGSPTTATLNSSGNFINGDGITIAGAGATLTLSTPAAPTVTPSIAIEGTGLGGASANIATKASQTASSTYLYKVIYRDAPGGFTAPSSATTITNGQATLGPITCNISTATRANAAITVNFSAPCIGTTVGARMRIIGVSNSDFYGWYNISTVNSNVQVVVNNTLIDSRSEGWLSTDGSSSTGGTATFYLSNHLNLTYQSGMWESYVCAERPGDVSFKLIGQTKPSSSTNGGIQDIQFDDYGPTYNDNQTYPTYITNTLCNSGSAQNDPLTTTISSGGGTTTLTLAAAATNAVTSALAQITNTPALIAAMNSVRCVGGSTVCGFVYISPAPAGIGNANYYFNSFGILPTLAAVKSAGTVVLNETLQLPNGFDWDGSWSYSGVPQFTQSSGSNITAVANPGFYAIGSQTLENLNISQNNTNGGVIEVIDGNASTGSKFENVTMAVNPSSGNYLGMALILRGGDGSSETKYKFINSAFTGAAPSSTPLPTPIIYEEPGQDGSGNTQNSDADFYFNGTNFAQQGFEWESCGGGPIIDVVGDRSVRQGGYMPLFTVGNCSGNATFEARFSDITLDTDTQGILNLPSPNGSFNSLVSFDNIAAGSGAPSGNGATPLVTGQSSANSQFIVNAGIAAGRAPTATGYGNAPGNSGGPFVFSLNEPGVIQSPNAYWIAPLPVPTSVSGTAANGGSIPSGTFQFAVTAVDVNGKETVPSALSSAVTTSNTCVASGNCEVNLTWSAPSTSTGALTYNVYACGNAGAESACPTLKLTTSGLTGTSTTLTLLTAGAVSPTVGLAGQAGFSPTIAWNPEVISNQAVAMETTAPSAAAGQDVCYGDSTAHAVKCSFNNGSFFQQPQEICTGQIALTTGAINSGTRATNTLACTGLSATTDSIACTFSGDTNAVTGYAPSASGGITLKTWASTNTINVDQVNDTGGSITPGAATVNCKGLR